MGNDLSYGLIITLFGMVIVFVVLIFLAFILEGMRIVFAPKKKEEKPVEIENTIPVQNGENLVDDGELVAAISAAIASCMGSEANFVVRSISRIPDVTPAWGKIGRQEQMQNRF